MLGVLIPLVILALIIVAIRSLTSRGRGAIGGHPVRHFFQYGLQYALVVIVASGVAGLLERVLSRSRHLTSDQSGLARNLAFVVVGLPLLALMAHWTRSRFRADHRERSAFGWAFYTALTALTALLVTMGSLHTVWLWVMGSNDFDPGAVALAVVWSAVWFLHLRFDAALTPANNRQLHLLIGSAIGLITAATGLGMLLAAALRGFIGLDSAMLVAGSRGSLARAAATFLVGAPVWAVYWLRVYARAERGRAWNAYVMVAGISGGLLTAVTSASLLLFTVLVWFIGTPEESNALQHFRGVPGAVATLFMGLLVWWYHRAVLAERAVLRRSEAQRIYEYLVGAIGLLAAASGLTIMLVALIESLTKAAAMAGPNGPRNTLLAAATLMVVGAPLWWLFWQRLELTVAADAEHELASPARRFYLFMLFGIGGTVAVIALITGVYFLFDDLVRGEVDAQTLRSMRYAIGLLITAGAVAGYHWLIYRGERQQVEAKHGPRYVVLVGALDAALGRDVAERTGGRVHVWPRTDDAVELQWTLEAVMDALQLVQGEDIVVVAEGTGLRAVPVDAD